MGCNSSTPRKLYRTEQGGVSRGIDPLAKPAWLPNSLCTTCAGICQRSRQLPTLQFQSVNIEDVLQKYELERFEHKNFQDLQSDSATRENSICHLCSIIQSVIACNREWAVLENNPQTSLTLSLSGKPGFWYSLRLSVGETNLRAMIEIVSPDSDDYRDGFIEEFPLAKLAPRVPSAPHFQLIKDWLEICEENHPNCKMDGQSIARSQTRPTRLIDLKDLRNAALYVTLSHRWGGSKYTLRQENLRAMMQGIPLRRLPRTFRDAMAIASGLGHRYIWIDSLCIVQNSDEDWNKESRLMAVVYSNGILNLAALGESSDTGCFKERNPLGRLPCKIPNTGGSAVYAQMGQADLDRYSSDMKHSVLLFRAWVVQERLLSRRNIFLGGQELSWECCNTQCSETYPKGMDYSDFSKLPLKVAMHGTLEFISDTVNLTPDNAQIIFGEFWFKIVKDYSAAELTRETDRPIALQGLVSIIQSRTRSLTGNRWAYIAGLWKEFLPVQLLWGTPMNATHNLLNSTTRLERWRQPSWSWWSLKHPIGVEYVNDASWRKLIRCKRLLYRSRVLSCQVTERTQTAALGDVTQAILKLHGYIGNSVEMKIRSRDTDIRLSGHPSFRAAQLDFGLPASTVVTLLLLTLYEMEPLDMPDSFKYYESGLVLLPRVSGEGYIRVGVFHHMCKDSHDDVLFTRNQRGECDVLLY